MSDGERIPLGEAESLATGLVALLAPDCERIEIAGSVRRRKGTVGDIEVVCIPRIDLVEVATDLFGNAQQVPQNALDLRCEVLLNDGTLRKRLNVLERPAWGTDLKWGTFRGFNVDIYSATVDTWGVTMLIRTGPKEVSNCFAQVKSGYTRDGYRGLLPDHIQLKGWRYVHRKTGEPYRTPEERDCFDLLGIPYTAPERREELLQSRWARVPA